MPVVAAIVPTAQAVHTEALAGENEPALQAVATDNPETPHADPAGHGAQAENPLAGAYVPALHAVATDKPVTPHADPAGHGVAVVIPALGQTLPIEQLKQAEAAFVGMYCPTVHSTHAEAPELDQEPGSQGATFVGPQRTE